MNDPSFKAEMKAFTDSNAYKTSLERAASDIEVFLFFSKIKSILIIF
jgi:hypothetical protein